jgi:hypothetical protein
VANAGTRPAYKFQTLICVGERLFGSGHIPSVLDGIPSCIGNSRSDLIPVQIKKSIDSDAFRNRH